MSPSVTSSYLTPEEQQFVLLVRALDDGPQRADTHLLRASLLKQWTMARTPPERAYVLQAGRELVARRNAAPATFMLGADQRLLDWLTDVAEGAASSVAGDAGVARVRRALRALDRYRTQRTVSEQDRADIAFLIAAAEAAASNLGDDGRACVRWVRAGLARAGLAGAPVRNAVINTPGAIKEEIDKTDNYIRTLGHDIYAQFCKPYQEKQEQAEAKFRAAKGRESLAGSADDWKEVAGHMGIAPDGPEVREKCFQPDFMRAFRLFLSEWDTFRDKHQSWYQNMWGKTLELAVDYRKRAVDWRDKFTSLGGKATSPAPTFPPKVGIEVPWGMVFGALGLLAVITVAPPLIGAVRGR